MRDEFKELRKWLELWGAYRRVTLILGYPTSSVSCNPDIHTALPIPEPSYKMPAYNTKLSSEANAKHFLAYERKLFEHNHIKRTTKKPKRVSVVPNYDPSWQMSLIDKEILKLSYEYIEVIKLFYQGQLKVSEIASIICRTKRGTERRLREARLKLTHVPRVVRVRMAG